MGAGSSLAPLPAPRRSTEAAREMVLGGGEEPSCPAPPGLFPLRCCTAPGRVSQSCVPAGARGSASTCPRSFPSTMPSSSSSCWPTSAWPPSWTQASSPEVSAALGGDHLGQGQFLPGGGKRLTGRDEGRGKPAWPGPGGGTLREGRAGFVAQLVGSSGESRLNPGPLWARGAPPSSVCAQRSPWQ